MSEFFTSTLDPRVLIRPTAGTGVVRKYTDFLATRRTSERLKVVKDPLLRGILVGEAVHGLLESGHKLGRALIMQAEEDENGNLEIDLNSQVNHGIAIGLGVGHGHVCRRAVTSALVDLAPRNRVELSAINSISNYTPLELEGMTTDHPELAELFPVPEVAIRFSVLGIGSTEASAA
jgi:hypothetical protein